MITNSIVRLMEMHASFNNILVNVNAALTASWDNLAVANKSAISHDYQTAFALVMIIGDI